MSQQFKVPRGLPIQPVQPNVASKGQRPKGHESSFASIFDTELQKGKVKFSAHATKRLEARKIDFTPEQLQTLEDAVDKARAKGGKETLILLDNVALVVSVANRTVITAMDGDNLRDNVFTQIDSAVII